MGNKKSLILLVLLSVFSIPFSVGEVVSHLIDQTNPLDNLASKEDVSQIENEVKIIEGELWNNEDLCRFTKGCFEEGICYPFGFIKESKYCSNYYIWESSSKTNWLNQSIEKIGFRGQSQSGEMCSYDFECKSNFCFNGKCVGSFNKFIADILLRISILEDRLGINEKDNVIQEEDQEEIDESFPNDLDKVEKNIEVGDDRFNFLDFINSYMNNER